MKYRLTFNVLFLIFVLCLNLANAGVVKADEGTPTEPPPTEVPVDPTATPPAVDEATTVASTPPAVEATEVPVDEATSDPSVEEVLAELPEDANIVVLDESGDPVSLASQEATDIILNTDPMWCPAGILPGDPSCSNDFLTIQALLADMSTSIGDYVGDGVIYFTNSVAGSNSFLLSDNQIGMANFDTIKSYNLTLQGGWNGLYDTAATFTGQTDMGTRRIVIGTLTDQWVGNITLNNFIFSNGTNTPIIVRTTTGDIALNNIDVMDQTNTTRLGILESASGDITIENSSFDGDLANQTRGLLGTTGGTIAITDTTIQETQRTAASATYEGAELTAPTITLTNVNASNNDGSGIFASGYDLLTLNNVIANNNGKDIGTPGLTGNQGSGVEANGNVGSRIIIIGGSFNNNQNYGFEVSESTVYIQLDPVCTGNVGGCTDTLDVIFDNTPPLVEPNITGDEGDNDWYTSEVLLEWDSSDDESDIFSTSGCDPVVLATETAGMTFSCTATNNAGLSATTSVTIKIDFTEEEEEDEDEDEGGETDDGSVPVTGGLTIDINCVAPSAFQAQNGSARFIFNNLCGFQAVVEGLEETTVPGELPAGSSFLNGFTINLMKDGKVSDPLPTGANIVIEFELPGELQNGEYAVLEWNDQSWVEIAGHKTADGYFSATVTEGGTFILVKK